MGNPSRSIEQVRSAKPQPAVIETAAADFLPQELFNRSLQLELRRTERSRRPIILMLLESATGLFAADVAAAAAAGSSLSQTASLSKDGPCSKVICALAGATRETDIRGWYNFGNTVGIIFTELGPGEPNVIANALLVRVGDLLAGNLTAEQAGEIKLSFRIFPEAWPAATVESSERGKTRDTPSTAPLERTELPVLQRNGLPMMVKRTMDIAGSLAALTVAAPALLGIALAVKLTSKGPVLFRQQRVGQFGRNFTFLKFRSMYTANNHAAHEAYVKSLIAGTAGAHSVDASGAAVFKITDDPRITKLGKFLRKTSLDELPQFVNVLLGDMSLVGPRPPIPYEVQCYDIWHRRRLLSVKPGITGLWQVTGRSKTTFDEMVRLDLRYVRSWSLALDVKILLNTPRAVLMGAH